MKKLLFICCVILLAAASCKKEQKAVTCRLTEKIDSYDSAQITYDANGRVSVYSNALGNAYTFNYSGLTAQCVVSYPGSTNTSTYQIYLNSQGQASSITYYVPPAAGGAERLYSYVFLYDNNSRIVKCEQSLNMPGTASDYFMYDSMVYENGNMIKKFTFAKGGSSTGYGLQQYSTTSYTETENKIGYHGLSYTEEPTSLLTGFYQFFHLYGQCSANLAAETNVYTATGTLSFRISYSYLFDELGNVTEENVARSLVSPSTENRKFYYECR